MIMVQYSSVQYILRTGEVYIYNRIVISSDRGKSSVATAGTYCSYVTYIASLRLCPIAVGESFLDISFSLSHSVIGLLAFFSTTLRFVQTSD